MKPYPNNNISYINEKDIAYEKNNTINKDSRYVIYNVITNLEQKSLEVKVFDFISKNPTFNGYYYTTNTNETLYDIAKKYYNREDYYWIIAKTNKLKDDGLSIIPKNTTLIIPDITELQKSGGYFDL